MLPPVRDEPVEVRVQSFSRLRARIGFGGFLRRPRGGFQSRPSFSASLTCSRVRDSSSFLCRGRGPICDQGSDRLVTDTAMARSCGAWLCGKVRNGSIRGMRVCGSSLTVADGPKAVSMRVPSSLPVPLLKLAGSLGVDLRAAGLRIGPLVANRPYRPAVAR